MDKSLLRLAAASRLRFGCWLTRRVIERLLGIAAPLAVANEVNEEGRTAVTQ